MWDWAAANQRKKDAVQQLAPLADALDDIESRIAELVARTKELELDRLRRFQLPVTTDLLADVSGYYLSNS